MINFPLEEILMHVCMDRTVPGVILKITPLTSISLITKHWDPEVECRSVQCSVAWTDLTVTMCKARGDRPSYSHVKDKVGQDYGEILDAAH